MTISRSINPTVEGEGAVVGRSGAVGVIDAVDVEFGSDRGDRSVAVIRQLSLSVHAGEFLVVVGRSGCGKTTILNLFSGLVTPTAGQVTVAATEPVQARKHIAYMFARDALLPWRTAQANVEYGLELRGVARPERKRIGADLLDKVGLAHAGGRYPSQLSQGMRQRVALARTWALQPALLLMDEPFAALDAQTRVEVQAEFTQLWSERRNAVVFVTHDLSEAITLADRILVMREGQIVKQFVVDIPRPRDPLEITSQTWYSEMYRQLRDLISVTASNPGTL
jgi:NitT/TauT family transport system ATP-binding protein